jgi:hypothetical protein
MPIYTHPWTGALVLMRLVLFVLLTVLAIRFAKVTHVALVVGSLVGPVTDFASGYIIQAKAR